jgi:hypothetical protein
MGDVIPNYRKWLEGVSTMLQVVVVKLSTFMLTKKIICKKMYQLSFTELIHMVVI